ncbi:DUF397 domain-containing protein [Streptomyces sp. WM6378]|uniref:DUF397 domain-containing protein n=1 Tax=Streptomyces sp. WM6378 TaxID=1415557 RepID=UPI0006AF9088|nr:DUF397 domain-containing protein [Streptomyces sp. WM6378]
MTTTDSLHWIKSSYSDNGGDCIEVCAWTKSSYSNNGGDCIEVATDLTASHSVAVRDSKNPHGPILILAPQAFTGLVEFAKRADDA